MSASQPRRPRYASARRLRDLGRAFRDALELGASLITASPAKPTAHLSRVYLVASIELAHGVLDAVAAGRPTNALRMARHIYEFELQLDYILDRPAVRLLQLSADGAQRALLAEELVPGLKLTEKRRRQYQVAVAKAKDAADGRRALVPDRAKLPTEEGWRLPSLEDMAAALSSRRAGRKEDYDLQYRGASQLSHPSLLGVATYFDPDAEGFVLRPSTDDPIRAAQALVLAGRAYIDILDTTNWQLGAALGADIRAASERFLAA